MFGKVAVLMGGTSPEREISLLSGNAILAALLRKGINAEGIDAVDDYFNRLKEGNFSRVFIALHGPGGEDGTVQGVLETLGLAYTGSGILGSALSMDKVRSKRIWQSMGIATPPYDLWHSSKEAAHYINRLGLPLTVKPIYGGSSIGVTQITKASDFEVACEKASQYGPVMIEPWIIGDEYTVGILGKKALPSIEITAKEAFYDYNAKYFTDDTQYLCPSPLTAIEEKLVQQVALDAFRAIDASGWGRVDFIRDVNGDFWLLEVNTIPGMTDHSLVPIAAKSTGLAFDDLVIEILSQTLIVESKPEGHLKGEKA